MRETEVLRDECFGKIKQLVEWENGFELGDRASFLLLTTVLSEVRTSPWNNLISWAWGCTPVILGFETPRQENYCKFPVYRVSATPAWTSW